MEKPAPKCHGAPMIASRRSLLASLLGALALLGCDDGAPPSSTARSELGAADPAVLRIAGTGTGIPLVARLADAWNARLVGLPVVVEPSVGSTGGIRAARDGAVDLGISARPLSPSEQGDGLRALPLARDAVVVAVHPATRVRDISSSALVDLLAGRSSRFADGTPATVLLRDRDDTAHSALERMIPALHPAREQAYAQKRFRVLRHDDSMGEAISSTPGALGPFSLGAIVASRLPLEVLAIDGVRPTLTALEEGRWVASRDISFVVRTDREARVASFLSFVAGADGQRMIREAGYLPLPP